MKIFVGVTDSDWYNQLRDSDCDEVNFWRPGGNSYFRALQPNDIFLFKLHSPYDYIVGGGFFVRFSFLPTFLAWDAFGDKNGTKDYDELNRRVEKYRAKNNMLSNNPMIGCIILTEPFFFDEEDWIPCPSDWKKNIVQGKTYDIETPIGRELYKSVTDRLVVEIETMPENHDHINRYAESLVKHRLGQGAFRVSVAEAYQRRCAITGEKTLPVLEAAHIKPYSENGPHLTSNGIFLKSDYHTLFDKGYITIDEHMRIDVSKRLNEDYGNGKDYYKHHGERLLILPENVNDRPSLEFLKWHNESVFLG